MLSRKHQQSGDLASVQPGNHAHDREMVIACIETRSGIWMEI